MTDRRRSQAEGAQITDTGPELGWHSHARCREGGPGTTELFFSEDLGDMSMAKSICATCPVMLPCLEGALVRQEPWGVWGGQLFLNGKVRMVKRRRGRPSKQPRPGDEVPFIPLPPGLSEELRTA